MVDLFFDNCAVEIVGAEALGELGHPWGHHDPVGLDVRDVVEHQAGDRDVLDVVEAAGYRDMVERSVGRVEGQRNESLEAFGLILQGAQADEMIHSVFFRFDVAVEHCAVGMKTKVVGLARGFDPDIAVDLVVADDASYGLGEDLGTAAGQGIHAGSFQLFEDLTNGELGACGEVADLNHREGLEVDGGEALLKATKEFAVPVEGERGVETADNVEFRDGFRPAFAGDLPGLFVRHGVAVGIADLFTEGTELALSDANVGGVDVTVDVVVSIVAVDALADDVGHVADGEDVGGAVHRHAVFKGEAFAGEDFLVDGFETGIVKHFYKPRLPCWQSMSSR